MKVGDKVTARFNGKTCTGPIVEIKEQIAKVKTKCFGTVSLPLNILTIVK